MFLNPQLVEQIRSAVYRVEPDAKIFLYGSYARGDFHAESDIDLLVLVKKNSITLQEEKAIRYSLYDLEIDTDTIISPIIRTENNWAERSYLTSLFENIQTDGVLL